MSELLADTTHVISAIRGVRGVRELFARLVQDGHTLAISAVTVAEIFAATRPHEEARTDALLGSFRCHEVSWNIARRAGMLRNSFLSQGVQRTIPDMIIAATALEYGLILITDNEQDFIGTGVLLFTA